MFLFASANPLIEKWISLINPGNAASHVSVGTDRCSGSWRCRSSGPLSMSGGAASARWQRVWPRRPHRSRKRASRPIDFFGVATILRSLILFNLLFAVQTVLDVVYLWGNATLPADISYASYAHRGAYPLILTALLAAGFVLAAMRPGRPGRAVKGDPAAGLSLGRAERPAGRLLDPAPRSLCADLPADLVARSRPSSGCCWSHSGLLLIVARIALNRSNGWLIRANLITLTATLYVCSLINFAADHRGLQCQPQPRSLRQGRRQST